MLYSKSIRVLSKVMIMFVGLLLGDVDGLSVALMGILEGVDEGCREGLIDGCD